MNGRCGATPVPCVSTFKVESVIEFRWEINRKPAQNSSPEPLLARNRNNEVGDSLMLLAFPGPCNRGLRVALRSLSKLKATFNFDSFSETEERNEEVEVLSP